MSKKELYGFRLCKEYHKFAAILVHKRLHPALPIEKVLEFVESFYQYVENYTTYEKEITKHQKDFTRKYGYEYTINTSRWPDYNLAEQRTGLSSSFMRNTVELLYQQACQYPDTEIGKILQEVRDA